MCRAVRHHHDGGPFIVQALQRFHDFLTVGTIEIAGLDTTAMSERDRTLFRRAHIGFVYQAFNLLPTLTVNYNALDPSLLTMPTLVIHGMFDPLAPPENLAKLYTRIESGNKQWVSVPDSDHAAFLESPRAYFINELVAFIEGASL